MKKEITISLISLLFGLLLGILIVRYLIPNEVNVLVSDRKTACEVKGGKYSLNYFDRETKGFYYEQCEVLKKEIKKF